MDEVERLLEELDRIAWFAHVGEPVDDGGVIQVGSWDEAWEAQQDESTTGASFHAEVDQSHPLWAAAYDRALAAVERSGRNRELSAGNPVARSAAWDAGGAAYQLATGKRDGFYLRLLDWYRRGHWPSGWRGDYPRGKLVVY